MQSDALLMAIREIRGAEATLPQPEDFVALGAAPFQPQSYKGVSQELLDAWRQLRAHGTATAALYVRLLVAVLLERFTLEESRIALPPSVRELYQVQLKRIRTQLESLGDSHYDFSVDPFIKDFAFLTHRFVPVGAEFAEPGAGVPRRPLLSNGIATALSAAWLMLGRARGFRPFLCLHAHPLALEEFHPEGWNRTYRRLADLLMINSEIKGITSASWFLDPKLRTISPHLCYLRDVPEQGGAKFFFSAHDRVGDSGALTKSLTRRAHFEQGRYVPAVYMRVWLRGDLLAWTGGG